MISLSSQNCNHVVCFNPWTKTEGKRLPVGPAYPASHVSRPRVNIGECKAGLGLSLMKEVGAIIVIMLFSRLRLRWLDATWCRRLGALKAAESGSHCPRQLCIFRCLYQCQDVPQCWHTDIAMYDVAHLSRSVNVMRLEYFSSAWV